MEYEIIINRGGEEIMRSGIEADQVIDLLLVGKNQETEEEEDKEEMPRKKPVPKEKMDTTAKKQRKPVTCSNCGGIGHQSRTCTKESNESRPVEDVPDGAMSVQTYLAVRKQKHDGRSVEDVVDGMEIDEDEVKTAFSSLTYSGYLALRA